MAMDYVLSLAAEVGAVDDKSIKAAQKIVQDYFNNNKIQLDFTSKITSGKASQAMKQISEGINAAYSYTVQNIKKAQQDIDDALSQGRTGDVTKLSLRLKQLESDLSNIKTTAFQTGTALKGVSEADIRVGKFSTELKTEAAAMIELEKALNNLSAAKQKYYQQQVAADEAPKKSKQTHQELAEIYRTEVKECEVAVQEQMKVAKQLGLGEKAAKKYNDSLKNTNKRLEEWKKKHDLAKNSNKSFIDGIKAGIQQFSAYNLGIRAVQAGVQLLIQGLQNAIQTVTELNKAMTDVQMVAMTNNSETAELANTYSKLAKQLGATTQQIAEGSSEWLRQGKTLEEVNDLMEATMTMSKVGAISSGDATEYLTSTLNGYKMEAKDAMSIVDKLSAVDLAAATSVEELALALQKTANMARTTGVELDEIIGMIATVSEVTRQAPEIVGTSFKTLFSRMTQVAAGKEISDEGELLNDVETTLNRAGIALRSSQNDWRDMYDVLDEVAGKWKELDDTQRSQIATALGGTRQKEVVLALMENWDRVAKYVKIAEESTGSASDKMQYYLESIEAATNRLKATWEEFIYSEGTVKFITGVINLATNLLDVLNKIGDWFAKFGWTSEDFKKEADDTQSKIQANLDRIKEINDMPWQDKTAAILDEKKALEAENEELEKNLKLQQERYSKQFEQERKRAGVKVTGKQTGEVTEMTSGEFSDFARSHNLELYDVQVMGAKDVANAYEELNNELSSWNYLSEQQIDKVNSTIEQYASYIQVLKSAKDSGQQLTQEEQNAIDTYDRVVDAFERKRQAATDAENALVSNAKKLIENEESADKARAALTEFVKEQIILNSSKLDLSQQIAQLNAVAEAAGAATSAIGALGSVQAVIKGGQPFFEYNGKIYRSQQEALSDYWNDLSGLTRPGAYYPGVTTGGTDSGGTSDPNAGLKKMAQNQIKLINKMKDKLNDIIDDINDKWDEEVEALEKANDELEQQIEYQRLLESMAAAKSQKKMIYKDGRFQYLEDTDAIAKAQKELDDFNRKKALQDKKDYIEEQRKLELGDLEDQVKYLEDKVKSWNDYIDRLDTEFSSYMDIFDDFIKRQQEGYFNDLEALKKYVEEKEALLKRATSAGSGLGGGYGGGTSGGSSYNPSTGASDTAPIGGGVVGAAGIGAGIVSGATNNKKSGSTKKTGSGGGGPKGGIKQFYAEGTTYSKGGLSVVGEKGAELRVLNRGDGIIPADITKNLWKWGSIDPDIINKDSKTNIQNYNIDVDNVSLPDVTKPEEFVSGLKNLALQRAYNR